MRSGDLGVRVWLFAEVQCACERTRAITNSCEESVTHKQQRGAAGAAAAVPKTKDTEKIGGGSQNA